MDSRPDSLFLPGSLKVCRADDSPRIGATEGLHIGKVPYTAGIQPADRAPLPGYDSGIACLLICTFLLLAFNLRNYTTMLKSLPRDLFSVRRRDNLFEEHTLNETRLLGSMILILCLNESILIFSMVTSLGIAPAMTHFMTLLLFAGVAAGYYLFQLAAYSTVGAVFADKVTSRLWLKGFNASQALLGLLLVVPALTVVFNPSATGVMVILAAILYLLARFIFIYKGFRLFYHKIGSIVYFILYLCTLEVVPLFILTRYYIFIAN